MTPKEIAERFNGRHPGEFRIDLQPFREYFAGLVYVAFGKLEPGAKRSEFEALWDGVGKNLGIYRTLSATKIYGVRIYEKDFRDHAYPHLGFDTVAEIIAERLLERQREVDAIVRKV